MSDARPAERDVPVARRIVSPALFAVVVVCFFLPFVTIACNAGSQELFDQLGEGVGASPSAETQESLEQTFSGWDLVTGRTDEADDLGGGITPEIGPTPGFGQQPPTGDTPQVKDSQPFAIGAFGIAILGIALSWLALWTGPVAGSALGIAGIVALFLLKGKVEAITAVLPPELAVFGGGIEFRWQIGFWIAMAAFGLAAAWSLFRLISEASARSRPGSAAPLGAPTAAAPPAPPPGDTPPAAPPPPE